MPESLNQSALFAMAMAFLLSLGALFFLFQRHIDDRPLLAYQPRCRVPWGPLAAMIPMLFLLLSIFGSRKENVNEADFILSGWLNSAVMIGFVGMIMLLLTAAVGADAVDLGLPTSHRQLARDVSAGVLACIAALIPVYLIQFALQVVLQPKQQHQLIEQLIEHHTPQMMLVGVVSAVVAAPVFEEFTFRVLLQGWLERREDELIGYRGSEPMHSDTESSTGVDDLALDFISSVNPAPIEPVPGKPTGFQVEDRPKHGIIAALPHGWTPILISSLAFGLAHVGHGVAPVPLVVFGIVLGYLYQRTHRLAASVAAHMFFNAYSMGLLWLQIG